jgi:hypothetical protein
MTDPNGFPQLNQQQTKKRQQRLDAGARLRDALAALDSDGTLAEDEQAVLDAEQTGTDDPHNDFADKWKELGLYE